MEAKIYLSDPITPSSELVETFNGTIADLKKRLIQLESGFCEDEKPWIRDSATAGKIFISALCEADFNHTAIVDPSNIFTQCKPYQINKSFKGCRIAYNDSSHFHWMGTIRKVDEDNWKIEIEWDHGEWTTLKIYDPAIDMIYRVKDVEQ